MAQLAGGWMRGEDDSVSALLERTVIAKPDGRFLDFSGLTFTYGDVWEETAKLARGLRTLSVSPGDTVIGLLANHLDAVACWLAVNCLGAIYVPLNTALKGEFLRHQIVDSGAAVIIADTDYAQRVLALADQLPDDLILLHRGPFPAAKQCNLRAEPLDEYRIDGGKAPFLSSNPGDIAALVYTAGTTGPSKGCALSHSYMVHVSHKILYMNGRHAEEVNWTALPLFHLNALSSVLSTMILGSSLAMVSRFSVSRFWPEIERTGARVVNVLGSMIPLIAKMETTDEMLRCFGQIRVAFGVPFTPELERIWRERFGVTAVGNPGYGTTEIGAIVMAKAGEGKPGSSGRRTDDFDVRIFDEDDHELPPGEVGEVVCRPLKPGVMFDGYWRRPEALAAMTRNLWFHTGDLGKFDEHGWFTFVDRKKDYLRYRGENISSFEVETAFAGHREVLEVAVHAIPSELTEDDVKATVVLRPGSSLTEKELCEWAIENLPFFAVPRYIQFRTELPKSPVGRVLKYQLREEGCTANTWDREVAGITFTRR